MKATKVGKDSSIQRMIKLVKEAEANKKLRLLVSLIDGRYG